MTELENVRTGIDAVIARALSENRIVGTVVLIARDGELVYQHAAGLADREVNREMRVETLFRLASVTNRLSVERRKERRRAPQSSS
jgi:CubicO group peptidase (beta-lactamase class C family)